MTRWALIFNPEAGSFRPQLLDAVQAELRAQGVTPLPMPTLHAGHATSLAAGVERVDGVAVFGGDGTLNEAANGIAGRDLPLAFLPGGTANVMAHELGLPRNPVTAARLLVRGRARPVRMGQVNGRYFLLMAGFGFDGAAVHRVSLPLKARIGKGAYLWAGLRVLAGPLPEMGVESESGVTRVGAWVIVSRARHYGGGFTIHPDVGLESPRLGLTGVNRLGMLPFLVGHMGLGLRRGLIGTRFADCTDVRVRSEAPMHAQVDGDYHGQSTEFHVRLGEERLPLLFPPRD